MNRRTETEDMIRAELDRHQVVYAFGEGSAHPFVSITGQNGQCRRIAYPGTPSDVRGILNTRAQVRRALREIGAQPWPEERESARVGSLGAALLDASSDEEQPQEEDQVATAQTNGHTNGAVKAAPPPCPERVLEAHAGGDRPAHAADRAACHGRLHEPHRRLRGRLERPASRRHAAGGTGSGSPKARNDPQIPHRELRSDR